LRGGRVGGGGGGGLGVGGVGGGGGGVCVGSVCVAVGGYGVQGKFLTNPRSQGGVRWLEGSGSGGGLRVRYFGGGVGGWACVDGAVVGGYAGERISSMVLTRPSA